MPTIQRPLKEGSVRTYQEKVGLGFLDILASEMDADLNTIYTAWNGGVSTADLGDNAVTSPKIALGAVGSRELADLGVATGDLANGAVTLAKLAVASTVAGRAENKNAGPFTVPGTQTTILSCPNYVSRGGQILLVASLAFKWQCSAAGQSDLALYLLQDGAAVVSIALSVVGVSGMAGGTVPLSPSLSRMVQPSAGTHSYAVSAFNSNPGAFQSFILNSDNFLTVCEFA